MTDLSISRKPFLQTEYGKAYCEDALITLSNIPNDSLDLIMTSPPFGLIKKKEYGNKEANNYLEWFKPFALQFHRVLKSSGSLVIDIGGTWNKGTPTRNLYHFKLLIMLCEEFGFKLAQEIYWWNPSKLPTPAEWVNIRRVRVKDGVNTVWWLSKSDFPKASNKRVLLPYSTSMNDLLENGYNPKLRPSGHNISDKFSINNGGSIPPNLLAIPNTESNGTYIQYCKKNKLKIHPARFPHELPEFFIRMLTDEKDLVMDPFGGSCVTGEVCERLHRYWICAELLEEYLEGAKGRFSNICHASPNTPTTYTIYNPSAKWKGIPSDTLPQDGGKNRLSHTQVS